VSEFLLICLSGVCTTRSRYLDSCANDQIFFPLYISVLRFLWVQSLIPPQSGASFEIPSYLTLITMALELFRRTLWGFFRLEHEHRHNTEGYRRVDFVPLHFATGHDRKYKKQQQRIGVNVLAEVFIISSFVIGISFLSIIAAQKATESSGGL